LHLLKGNLKRYLRLHATITATQGTQSQELKQITETDDAVQSKYDNANFGANLNAKVLRRLTLRATSALFPIHFRNIMHHITAQNENKMSQCLSVME
jgi:hypothetical protein